MWRKTRQGVQRKGVRKKADPRDSEKGPNVVRVKRKDAEERNDYRGRKKITEKKKRKKAKKGPIRTELTIRKRTFITREAPRTPRKTKKKGTREKGSKEIALLGGGTHFGPAPSRKKNPLPESLRKGRDRTARVRRSKPRTRKKAPVITNS